MLYRYFIFEIPTNFQIYFYQSYKAAHLNLHLIANLILNEKFLIMFWDVFAKFET